MATVTAVLNGHNQREPLELRAHALIARAAGLEDAGQHDLAHEARYIANALLETLAELAQERAIRTAVQARNAQLQQILGKAVYQACQDAAPDL